jgi:hypothetical protein
MDSGLINSRVLNNFSEHKKYVILSREKFYFIAEGKTINFLIDMKEVDISSAILILA